MHCLFLCFPDSRVMRRLDFVAEYDISCSLVNTSANLIKSVVRVLYVEIEDICAGGDL